MPTISKSIAVSDGGVYTVHLNIIPDGSTVTPVNDIQTWLHCGDIWDKDYTTLNEVLADNTTLLALISSNNAVDYMVRSTEWATGVGLVPVMTSYTTPVGEVIASSDYGVNYEGWKAFDGTNTGPQDAWVSNNGKYANEWLGYHFTSPVIVGGVYIQNRNVTSSSIHAMKTGKLQGSNDGGTWVDIQNLTNSSTDANAETFIPISNTIAYSYYRVYVLTVNSTTNVCFGRLQFNTITIVGNQIAMGYIGNNNYCANKLLSNSTWLDAICNSEYFGSVLNVKVPTMTSNTTPSGVASIKGGASTAYKAFDGNTADAAPSISNATLPAWIQYQFPSAVKIYKFVNSDEGFSQNLSYLYAKYKIEASNDGSNYTEILSEQTLPSTGKRIEHRFSNPSAYKYYRFSITGKSSSNTKNVYFAEHQYYGRA